MRHWAQVGGWAVVRATQKPDNSLLAEEIEVLRGPDMPPEPIEFSGVIESFNAQPVGRFGARR